MNKYEMTSSEKLERGCRIVWPKRQKRELTEKLKKKLAWKKKKEKEKLQKRPPLRLLLLKLKPKPRLMLKKQHT